MGDAGSGNAGSSKARGVKTSSLPDVSTCVSGDGDRGESGRDGSAAVASSWDGGEDDVGNDDDCDSVGAISRVCFARIGSIWVGGGGAGCGCFALALRRSELGASIDRTGATTTGDGGTSACLGTSSRCFRPRAFVRVAAGGDGYGTGRTSDSVTALDGAVGPTGDARVSLLTRGLVR